MDKERASGSVFLELTPLVRIHPELADEAMALRVNERDMVMTPKAKSEIVRKIQGGCDESFTKLYNHYEKKVFNHALYILRNRETAQDITNATFISIYKAIGAYVDRGATLDSWVMTIAHNKSLDWVKGSKKTDVISDKIQDRKNPWSDVEHQAEINDDIIKLRIALLKLSPKYRDVITLKYVDGLDNKEIALLQNKKVSAVRVIVFRAKAKLKKLLADMNTLDIGKEGVA